MRRLTATLIATVSVITFAPMASAADLPRKAPPAPLPPLVYNWSGFYIGGSVGARWAKPDWTTTTVNNSSAPFAGTIPNAQFDSQSARAGVYLGYNFQFADRWVAGIEGDFAWADSKESIQSIPGTIVSPTSSSDSAQVKTTWDGGLRGRLGFLVQPTVLVFATGGVSWIHLEASASCGTTFSYCNHDAAPNIGTTWTTTTNRVGWVVGAGAEWMIAPNWLLRGEYRYADYGTASLTFFNSPAGVANLDVLGVDVSLKTHTAITGLAYKF